MKFALRLTLVLVMAGSLAAVATSPGYLLDAIAAQRILSAQNPSDSDVLNDLANLLAMAGKLSEAEEVYWRAVDLSPSDTSIRYNLALVLMEQGNFAQAMDELSWIIESEPRHAWAHYQLGTLHARKNNRVRAIEHYEQAFALDWNLISPAINPHIVENHLATDAMLRAYRSQSPAATAPRLYQQPDEVAELLVPRRVEPQKTQPEPNNANSTSSQDFGTSYTDLDETEVTESEDDRVLTESDLQGRTVSTTDPVKPRRKSRPRKKQPSSTYVEPPQTTVSTSGSDQSSEPTRSPTRQPRTSTGSGMTGVGGQQAAPGSGTFFQPGTASTGRLDLELLPVAPTRQTDTPT